MPQCGIFLAFPQYESFGYSEFKPNKEGDYEKKILDGIFIQSCLVYGVQ